MRNLLIASAALFFLALPVEGQRTVRCESSDNRYNECQISGIGRVALARQLSDSACVEGRSWGYRDGVVWVDRGCRGEFQFIEAGFDHRQQRSNLVVCESRDGNREVCRVDTGNRVEINQQLSRSECVLGRTWGFDRNSIWVDRGCRAEFAVGRSAGDWRGSRDRDRWNEPLDQRVTCESSGNRPNRCPADGRAGVQLVRQMSSSSCAFGRDWGYDATGIWVANGCRAEFAVRAVEPALDTSVTCESTGGRRNDCRVDTSGGVRLTRQLSDSQCVFNRSWGYDRNGIWVTQGCRAEFAVGAPLGSVGTTVPRAMTVLCESQDGRRAICPADTRGGVSVLRQLSRAECVRNRTWGFDRNGIWVDQGCRAEFAVGR